MTNITAGKCKPRFKSQPIPKSNSEPMKVIVADSFDKEVNKTKKNVVLALYSLGGERSETYMPTVETLAKMFKDEKVRKMFSMFTYSTYKL